MQVKMGCIIEALKKGEIDSLVHQANCFHTMGSGIAKDIAKNFPIAYFADKNSTHAALEKLGKFTKAELEHGRMIYNLYGQYTYGRNIQQTDYHLLLGAFRSAVRDAIACGCRSMGIPFKMGCVNAGGDWEFVKSIVIEPVEQEVLDTGFQFIVYQKLN